MRTYHEALHDFYASTVSFALPYLSRSAYRGYRVGDAAMAVADIMLHSGSAYQSLFRRARLVSVKSWRSRFSYGLVDPSVHPAINNLVLTFSIDRPGEFPAEDDVDLVRRPISNRFVIYGTRHDPVQFFSVGLDSVQCAAFDFSNLQDRALRYLYMALGVVLRSTFHRSSQGRFDKDDLVEEHEKLDGMTIGALPLNRVFEMPYEKWPFYKSVWSLAPNLIASRQIDGYTAASYLRFAPNLNVDFRDATYDLIWDDDAQRTTVFSIVRSSLLSFIQAVNTQDARIPQDKASMIAAGLLYNLIFVGKPGLSTDLEYVYTSMVKSFNERGPQLSALFEPLDLTTRRLMRGETSLMQKLTENIDIFD